LPLTDADLGGDIETILRLVIHEGCVGETVAALEAVEARAHCSTSEVSCVLERIARDEQNHAALAWRFVAWAIEQQPRLREVAEREFRRIAEQAPCATPNAAEPDLSAHGALPLRLRNELREAAVRDVVVPCAKRLLGSSMAPRPAQASV
jgi:hypothetical protein